MPVLDDGSQAVDEVPGSCNWTNCESARTHCRPMQALACSSLTVQHKPSQQEHNDTAEPVTRHLRRRLIDAQTVDCNSSAKVTRSCRQPQQTVLLATCKSIESPGLAHPCKSPSADKRPRAKLISNSPHDIHTSP